MEASLEGGCLCGAVRYRVAGIGRSERHLSLPILSKDSLRPGPSVRHLSCGGV